ncbi:redoxin domain-containing protein (plasmid) [Mycetohabitans rhizoxinica]|jgi:peroxiredoxin (alkyl hydroperoxide reductase subunit C)|uniref:redoxin domain-containing protein n=1 Tax=Mycetohabitans rhizoxinica TaxID=412963 RepID=UPI0030D0F9AF
MSIINSRIKPFNATAYHNGQFVLVSDQTQAISRDFDVLVEEEGMALRGTFVVNPTGEIKLCEVCAAKWSPGAQTLKPSLDLIGRI